MLHARTLAPAILLLFCACLAAGCLSEEEKAHREFEEKVLKSLEGAPPLVAAEITRSCDKWRRLDGSPCDEVIVRHDQFECWLERGLPKLEHGYKYQLRPRTRDLTTLLKQDTCMKSRGWRLLQNRRTTYAHIFGESKPRPAEGEEKAPAAAE